MKDDQQTRDRRERRQRLVLLWAALGFSALAVVISVVASGDRAATRADVVASEVAPQVAERVVQDARQARVETGRRELSEANTQLIARSLPTVADPGNGATGDELVIAAATARVLSILPETTVGRLRDEVAAGRTPPILPSATQPADLPLTDGVVSVLPEPGNPTLVQVPDQEPDRTGRPAPAQRAPAARPVPRNTAARPAPRPAAPAPVPQAPPPRRGLCLLGVLLCTS